MSSGLRAIGQDLSITELQLRTFAELRKDPDAYISRVVEHLSFLPAGGQQWTREMQVQIPAVENTDERTQHLSFIVSLGKFERRRFPDFTVIADDGSRCHLLSRQQHGQSIVFYLLRQFLYDDEWRKISTNLYAADILERLWNYLLQMITAISPNDSQAPATPAGARVLLSALLVALGTDLKRISPRLNVFYTRCAAALGETEYLCWVVAKPGDSVHLCATYSQADSPQFKDDSEGGTESKRRLWFRNYRSKQYAKYNLYPMRYTFSTPAYRECRSYYFTVTPPPETRVVLLDWGQGHRFHVASRNDTDWSRRRHWSQTLSMTHEATEEVDCANFAYHFHNRRVTNEMEARNRRMLAGIAERRSDNVSKGIPLHVFIRSIPSDNGKVGAIGFLGLVLAILAERGVLFTNGTTGTSQWLLLSPAALLVFVGQQQRHHYASFTRPFRLAVWLYVAVAMAFALSTTFKITSFPLMGYDGSEIIPRSVSAFFAVASGAVMFLAWRSSKYFDSKIRHRYRRVLGRVGIFHTPSLSKIWRKYRWRRKYWRKPKKPLAREDVRTGPILNHPSNTVYTSIARHSIDRTLGVSVLAILLIALAMVNHCLDWHWGVGEQCAIVKEEIRQADAQEGKPLGRGGCVQGQWQVYSAHTASPEQVFADTNAHWSGVVSYNDLRYF